MPDDAGKRSFLLALSHREKSNALKIEADQALAAGRLEESRHAALHDFYTKHLHDAESHLARLQELERRKLDSLEHQLRATINHQAGMVQRAMDGKIPAAKANELNRQYQREIAELETRIAASNELLNATAPSELGGFVDLPLESYVPADDKSLAPPDRWEPRRWAIVIAALFVFALLLFLVLRRGPAGTDVDASFAQLDPVTIRVTVSNSGSRPAELYAPWPEAPALAESGAATLGLRIHVREEGQSTYKLLPGSDECWKSNGYIFTNPIEVIPKIPVEVTLDIACLQRLANRPTAVRVTLASSRGRTFAAEEFAIAVPR